MSKSLSMFMAKHIRVSELRNICKYIGCDNHMVFWTRIIMYTDTGTVFINSDFPAIKIMSANGHLSLVLMEIVCSKFNIH